MDNKKRMFRRLRYLTLILVMYTILVAFINTQLIADSILDLCSCIPVAHVKSGFCPL